MTLSRFYSLVLPCCLALSLSLVASPVAFGQSADPLAAYEQRLFSHSYESEPLESRLNRLETSVFGGQQTGSAAERQNRLLELLAKIQKTSPAQESAQTEESAPDNGYQQQATRPQAADPEQEPDATDYPTVTALEREVFGRDFIYDPIGTRLSRIEKKVFQNTYENMALVDRVDKLLMRYPNVTPVKGQTTAGGGSNSVINSLPDNSSQMIGSRDMYTKVNALEQAHFGGRTFSEKMMTERLDQLEMKVFGKIFVGNSVDTRLNRLIKGSDSGVATTGTGGARQGFIPRQGYTSPDDSYSSNIGAYQPAPQQRAPQNIQIGAGFSQNSRYSFSPEMMSMLPPDIRNQLSGGQASSGGGMVVTSPGTVVTQQTTQSYPGFQPYGNAPMQYQNYYGPPRTTTSTQTTTVLQPNGATTVYGYQNTPAYTGNPAFLQNLGNLEINLFGQVNTIEPVPVRLAKLEQMLLGQPFPTYSETDRLANLQRTYQYQSLGRLFGKNPANAGHPAGSPVIGIPLNNAPNMKYQPGTSGLGVPIAPH